MSQDYKAVANGIIHAHFKNYRREVWLALQRAYQDGLDDATRDDEIERAIREIRQSGRGAAPSMRPASWSAPLGR
jgi:hypothetical protein